MSEKRQKLQRQADALYNEWSEAKSNLDRKATSVKKILVMVAVGYSLVYLYRLINSSDDNENKGSKKSMRPSFFENSRFVDALKTLLLPLLIKIVKREILESTDTKNN